ncbi:transposase family protein, partial [Escherichia coli 5.2239]
GVYRGVFR